jgi:diketogulonate reductase-like aldo/keto reductase
MASIPSVLIDAGRRVHIPVIGYGTGTAWYKSEDKPLDMELVKCIKAALAEGYTHIDAAEVCRL